jgi:hypothetical protein
MSTDAQPGPAVTSPVLLVVVGGTVSRAAIVRTAQLAAGEPVTVIGVRASAEPEKVRRTVARAMTALVNTGVMAHAHIAASGSPARAIARVARARGARIVVLDSRGALAAELRRRVYGSGIIVVPATQSAGRLPVPRDLAR